MVSCSRQIALKLCLRGSRFAASCRSCWIAVDAIPTSPLGGSEGTVVGSLPWHPRVESKRFSTSTPFPNVEVAVGHDGVVLDPESNPDMLFESLGMSKADLYELAARPPTPLTISDMYKYATAMDKVQRLRNAQFLHRELPIRVAQRAVDLLTLPNGLSEAKHIQQVSCAYISKLHSLLSFSAPRTLEEEEQFTDMLQLLALDRSYIPKAISQGLVDWYDEKRELEIDRLQDMEDALYRFFTARVGLRLLIEHHVLSSRRECAKALRKSTSMFPDDDGNHAGCINSNLDLVKEISRVANMVVQQTKDFYGASPEIEVVDCIDKKDTRDFTYILNHLHDMMGELLKNSCRATVRHFLGHDGKGINGRPLLMGTLSGSETSPTLPPIRVVVVKGEEDVTIKVADKGGGIPRSRMAKIWKFAHSTADKEENYSDFGMDSLSGTRIRGFGLPLCRIYARYLGGELTLRSMEGYGLDAYLHLPRLGDACENLPSLVRHSPGGRDSTPGRNVRRFTTMVTNQTSCSNEQPQVASMSTDILMEQIRDCFTEKSKNKRVAFLESRT